MPRECWERFPRHWLEQSKPLVSDPGMHHVTCVTHASWCMSRSLIRGGGENVYGIPGACATRNFAYMSRGLWGGTLPRRGMCDISIIYAQLLFCSESSRDKLHKQSINSNIYDKIVFNHDFKQLSVSPEILCVSQQYTCSEIFEIVAHRNH